MKKKFLLKPIMLTLAALLTLVFLKFSFSENTDPRLKLLWSAEKYIEERDFISAEKNLKEALAKDAKDSAALRLLALIHRMQFEATKQRKFLELAKVEIEKSLKYTPNDLYANGEAAMIYYHLKDKDKAMKAIEFAIKKDPQSSGWKSYKAQIQAMK